MKKIILHFLLLIFVFVNFSHNHIMAFSSEMSLSMGNHSIVSETNECCDNIKEQKVVSCEVICCYDKSYTITNLAYLNQSKSFKKKLDKIKISFLDIGDLDNFNLYGSFIGNISPPKNIEINNKSNNLYIDLVGIIKSNT